MLPSNRGVGVDWRVKFQLQTYPKGGGELEFETDRGVPLSNPTLSHWNIIQIDIRRSENGTSLTKLGKFYIRKGNA